MKAIIPFPLVEQVFKVLTIPTGVAGGMRADTAPLAIKSGTKVAVVGGAITRAANPDKPLALEGYGEKVVALFVINLFCLKNILTILGKAFQINLKTQNLVIY